MWRYVISWTATAIVVGLGVWLAMTPRGRQLLRFVEAPPVIDCPSRIEMGEHEKGERAVKTFTIANLGATELFINDISSNCGCTGLEQEKEGRYERIDSLRIGGGKDVQVLMRVAVGGVPVGAIMINKVQFRTNDPRHPLYTIEAVVRRVLGGAFTIPEAFVFGTVHIGSRICETIEIHDGAVTPRKVKQVRSTRPDLVTVRLLPENRQPSSETQDSDSTIIGQFEAIVNTHDPGEVNVPIEIELQGEARRPDIIPVIGRIAPAFELAPSSLVLPLFSNGHAIYTATSLCRGMDDQALNIDVDSAPAGIEVEVLTPSASSTTNLRSIRVTLIPSKVPDVQANDRKIIRLKARAGNNEQNLSLPVVIRKEK